MKHITAFGIVKGGTGKSSSCAALAQAAAADGKRVLCIDLDPQANLSFILAADQNRPGCYELLHGSPAADVIQRTEQGIDVIAASPDLATEKTAPGSAKRLQDAIAPLKRKYDWVFIDTAPMTGELLFNALQAATELIVPLEADSNSLQGLYGIVSLAHQMQSSNRALKIRGTILTRYDARQKISRYLQEVIAEKGRTLGAPLLGAVRPGVAIKEAQALQLSLYEYAPSSKPAQDYLEIYRKLQEG